MMVPWRRRTRSTARESFHDSDASATASRWLGVLAAESEAGGLVLPPVITVEADNRSVRLKLAAPRHQAPTGWLVSPDGASWTRRSEDAAASARGQVPRGLTVLGLRGRPAMLVDLSRASGLIALKGEPAHRFEVAHRWLDERARASWSRAFPVTLVDLPELATDTTVASTLRQVANVVEIGGEGFTVLRELPTGRDRDRLLAALAVPGCRWTIVVLGETEARWSFHAEVDGSVTSDVFPSEPLAEASASAGASR